MFVSLLLDLILGVIALVGVVIAARARSAAGAAVCALALGMAAIAAVISLQRDVELRESASETLVANSAKAAESALRYEGRPATAGELQRMNPSLRGDFQDQNADLGIRRRGCKLIITASADPDTPFLSERHSVRRLRLSHSECRHQRRHSEG